MKGRLSSLLGRSSAHPQPAIPVAARHAELSVIASLDDEPAAPTPRLFDVGLAAAQRARSVSMAAVTARMKAPPYYPEVWPGEHYKLLAGLVLECRPKLVIEIGTATGISALAIRGALAPGARVVTFDLLPWNTFPDTAFRPEDFEDGAIRQELADVADPAQMKRHADLFREADMLFVDGPKDGKFESAFLDRFESVGTRKAPLVVFDDIRVWNMLAIWRAVKRPKLDMTSFGHWSGTGLVDWV